MQRLQKIMAAAGIASRRKSEELIATGRVTVNGQIVSELGAKADDQTDHIRVDGKLLHGPERKIYLMLNKPVGFVTTVSDPEGRPTVMQLVRNMGVRLFPVGRLDYASEGLLLLTNDGALAQKLTRAASHVPKTYLVKVSGQPPAEALQRLRDGIYLRGEKPGERPVKTAPAGITLARPGENPWYEVTLTEGRNRQIRRMFEQVGHRVEKIKRMRYGPLELDIEPGMSRQLTPREVEMLERWQSSPIGRRPLPSRPPFASKPYTPLGTGKAKRISPQRTQRNTQPEFTSDRREGARPAASKYRPSSPRPFVRKAEGESESPRFSPSRSIGARPSPDRRERFHSDHAGERPSSPRPFVRKTEGESRSTPNRFSSPRPPRPRRIEGAESERRPVPARPFAKKPFAGKDRDSRAAGADSRSKPTRFSSPRAPRPRPNDGETPERRPARPSSRSESASRRVAGKPKASADARKGATRRKRPAAASTAGASSFFGRFVSAEGTTKANSSKKKSRTKPNRAERTKRSQE